MPNPKKSTRNRSKQALVYRSPREREPYVRGASGLSRPEPTDTYVLAGVAHTFDGKCHADCENVR